MFSSVFKFIILVLILLAVLPGVIVIAADDGFEENFEQVMGGGEAQAAGGGCSITDFKSVVTCVTSNILNPIIGLLVGAALVIFLVGVVKYIAQGDKPEERSKGAAYMFYGIVGLFVMISVWGLVSILTKTFFSSGNNTTTPPIPTISL